jgi:hypothetical protein
VRSAAGLLCDCVVVRACVHACMHAVHVCVCVCVCVRARACVGVVHVVCMLCVCTFRRTLARIHECCTNLVRIYLGAEN